jgi:hypothetical protein
MLKTIRASRAHIAWPTLAAFVLSLSACVGYTARDIPNDDPLVVGPEKILVLHQGDNTWFLGSSSVDKQGIRGVIPVPNEPIPVAKDTATSTVSGSVNLRGPATFPTRTSSGMAYLPPKSQRIDIYLSPGNRLSGSAGLVIPWKDIERITVYDVSIGKTILIWSTVAVSAAAIAFLIFLLTKSSCPFVYADNGNGRGYGFQGEVFSGAIYPQLERADWLPLPEPSGEEYRLRITNEVKEIQHMDRAALWLVRHPAGTGVLLDSAGRPHTFSDPSAPVRCVTVAGRDASALIATRDSLAYLGGDGPGADGRSDGLDLTFAKPPGARAAKLILRAKNSFWLDYLYGQFQDLFGQDLDKWNGKMRRAPKDKLEEWFHGQGLPLAVEVRGPGGWRTIASLPLPGPMAARDFLLPLEAPEGDSLRVRLRCGFGFWEIDYAAVDYSADAPTEIVRLEADSAVDQDGRDLKALLAAEDGRHYDQPHVGDAAFLRFTVPAAPAGTAQAAFFATRGYYDILRSPNGRSRTAQLKGFREPGALSRFSAERMRTLSGGEPHAF